MLSLSLQTNAMGRVINYEELSKNYFGSIRSITECGHYLINGELGEYRLIQSYIYGGSMLFIDKVKMGHSTLEVVLGFTFAEINNDHFELNVENVFCKTDGEAIVFLSGNINGTGHEEDTKYNFTIRLNAGSGSYQYEEVLNKALQPTPTP